MKKFYKGFCQYNGKRFYLNLTDWANGKGNPVIEVVEPNGDRRPATNNNANLIDLLSKGRPEEGAVTIEG